MLPRTLWLGALLTAILIGSGCETTPPGTCKTNSDCDGQARCVDARCLAPGTCSEDSHCLFGQICQAGACIVFKCKADADCKDGEGCQSGQCVALHKRGERCGTDDIPCVKGHVCVAPVDARGDGGVCFQECDPTAKAPCGEESCVPFARHISGRTISVCLKEVASGERCGYNSEQQRACQRGQYPPLYCSSLSGNTCVPATIRTGILEFCSLPTDVDKSEWLLCDEGRGLYCDPTTKTCQKAAITVNEGQECDLTGQALGQATLCANGARCLNFNQDGSLRRCATRCDPGQDNPCPLDPTHTCAPIYQDGSGICTRGCRQDSDCQHQGYVCRQQPGGSGVCLPDFPTGDVDVGGLCAPTDEQMRCKPGLFCLKVVESSRGFCSKECTASSDCPDAKTPDGAPIQGECIALNGTGFQGCVYPCETQDCPQGLVCKAFGKKRCFAP